MVELDSHVVHVGVVAQGEEHVAHGVELEVLVPVGRDAPLAVVAVEELLERDGHLPGGPSASADVLDEGLLLGEIHAVSGPWGRGLSIGRASATLAPRAACGPFSGALPAARASVAQW